MQRERFRFFLLLLVGATMGTFFLIATHSKTKPLLIDGGTSLKDKVYVYHQNHNRREFLPKSWTANQTKVFYNKVPKCGSRTMTELISRIQIKRNFKVRSWSRRNGYTPGHHLNHQQQRAVVRLIDEIQAPVFYSGELHFIDFKRFGSAQPVYINLIRDPLDRLVSEYYYRRFKDERETHKNWQFPGDLKNQTFDSCVLNSSFECVNDSLIFRIIPYFCGQDDMCRLPSEKALNQAKFNVISNYLIVGILPEFEVFLLILEKLLPKLFTGISEVYRNPGQQLKNRITTTKTKHKQDPSPEAAKVMKERLKMEYEFYDFVKERFQELKHDLGFGE